GPLSPESRMELLPRELRQQPDQRFRPGEVRVFLHGLEEAPRHLEALRALERRGDADVARDDKQGILQQFLDELRIVLREQSRELRDAAPPGLLRPRLVAFELAAEREEGVGGVRGQAL